MNDLRQKAKAAGLGDSPPRWGSDRLGRADSDPAGLMSGLGLSSFKGTGSDWITDVYNVLRIAFRSSYLNGIYSEPVPYRTRNGISVGASAELYQFSEAVMMRMIKSILWAAEKTGRVALPSRLRVELSPDKTGVWISVD